MKIIGNINFKKMFVYFHTQYPCQPIADTLTFNNQGQIQKINLSSKLRLPHPISTMSGNVGSAKTWFQSGTCAGTYQEKELH